MRGRNNNNNNSNGGSRRGPNPLTRSYESNGPDVKIRGTAQHIGEKYLQLARDAQTSGDPVAAENYLQHAEHYFRIIAAAQQAQQQAQTGYQRQPGEQDAEEVEAEEDLMMPDRFSLPSERFAAQQQQTAAGGTGPQPYPERGSSTGERQNNQERDFRQQGGENGYRADRQDRGDRDQRQDRNDQRQDRTEQRTDQRQDRNEPRQDRGDRQDRDQRQDRGEQRPYGDRANYDRNNGERTFRNDRGQRSQRYQRDGQDNRDGRGDQGGYRDPSRAPQQGGEPSQPVAVEAAPEAAAELPAFITAPVRPTTPVQDTPAQDVVTPEARTREEPAALDGQADGPVSTGTGEPSSEGGEGEAFTVRPRRRRRTRAMIEAEAAAAAAGSSEPQPSE